MGFEKQNSDILLTVPFSSASFSSKETVTNEVVHATKD